MASVEESLVVRGMMRIVGRVAAGMMALAVLAMLVLQPTSHHGELQIQQIVPHTLASDRTSAAPHALLQMARGIPCDGDSHHSSGCVSVCLASCMLGATTLPSSPLGVLNWPKGTSYSDGGKELLVGRIPDPAQRPPRQVG